MTISTIEIQWICLLYQYRISIWCHRTTATGTADKQCCLSLGNLMSWHKENSALLDLFCMQASICCTQPLANRFSLPPPFLFISYRIISLDQHSELPCGHSNTPLNLNKSNNTKDLAWNQALLIQSIFINTVIQESACYPVPESSENIVCLHC